MRISDIAKAANVSTATISRVINEKKGVSDAERERIKKIIEEYYYQPNLLGQTLRIACSRCKRTFFLQDDIIGKMLFPISILCPLFARFSKAEYVVWRRMRRLVLEIGRVFCAEMTASSSKLLLRVLRKRSV